MNRFLRHASLAACLGVCAGLAGAQQVRLEFLTWYNASQEKDFRVALAEYEAAHPNVKITLNTVAGTGAAVYPNTLRTRIAGGQAPDLFMMWGGSLAAPFIDAKAATDLAPYFKKYNWDSILIPAAVNALKRNGTLWGAPINLRAVTFHYRKDLFEKAGVKVPATMAELEASCDRFKAMDITCLATGGTFGWHQMRVFDFFLEHTAGPELHDQLLAGKASWDRPEVVAAFAQLKKWHDKGWFPLGYGGLSPNQAQQLLLQGRAAMIPEGDWFVPTAVKAGLTDANYGFFAPPTDRKPLRVEGFAEQYMIAAQSKNADAVAHFMNWWLQPATQNRHYMVHGSSATQGATPNAAENPLGAAYKKMVAGYGTYTIMDQAFSKEQMDTGYFRLQTAVTAGQITPAAAARELQRVLQGRP